MWLRILCLRSTKYIDCITSFKRVLCMSFVIMEKFLGNSNFVDFIDLSGFIFIEQ